MIVYVSVETVNIYQFWHYVITPTLAIHTHLVPLTYWRFDVFYLIPSLLQVNPQSHRVLFEVFDENRLVRVRVLLHILMIKFNIKCFVKHVELFAVLSYK